MEDASWHHRFTPQNVEVNYDDVPHMCIYIRHPTDHFDVVLSVLQNRGLTVVGAHCHFQAEAKWSSGYNNPLWQDELSKETSSNAVAGV